MAYVHPGMQGYQQPGHLPVPGVGRAGYGYQQQGSLPVPGVGGAGYSYQQQGYPPAPGFGGGYQQSGVPLVPGGIQPNMFPNKLSEAPPYIRNDFIIKVYSILFVQLLITVLISVCLLKFTPENWMKQHSSLLYLVSMATLFFMIAVQCCCVNLLRAFPVNYFILLGFTTGMSLLVALFTSNFTSSSVLLAVATTVGVFLVLTVYACTTRSDFTGIGPYLFAALASLCVFGFLMIIFQRFLGLHMPFLHVVYSACGVLIFSLYTVYDTQLILGGKKHQFDVDDYCFAALTLYLDFINLFMHILSLMGNRQ